MGCRDKSLTVFIPICTYTDVGNIPGSKALTFQVLEHLQSPVLRVTGRACQLLFSLLVFESFRVAHLG